MSANTKLSTFDDHEGLVIAAALSFDGSTLATGGVDRRIVYRKVTNLSEGHEVKGEIEDTTAMAFGDTNEILFTGGSDGIYRQWDLVNKVNKKLAEQEGSITALAFKKNGRQGILAGSSLRGEIHKPSVIRFRDGTNGKEIATAEADQGEISSLAFSMDGILLASAGSRA